MPAQTISLIDQLEQSGMPEPAFQALHHRGTSMGNMRDYCASLKKGFQTGENNEQFKQRLEIALLLVRVKPPEEEMDWYRLVAEVLSKKPLQKSA